MKKIRFSQHIGKPDQDVNMQYDELMSSVLQFDWHSTFKLHN